MKSARHHLRNPDKVAAHPVLSDRRGVRIVLVARYLDVSGCNDATRVRVRFPLVLRGVEARNINLRAVAMA